VEYYFAYGSNLKGARMRSRVEGAETCGVGFLDDFRWRCNKLGADGSAKANIERFPGARVWGVVFELETKDWTTLDGFEGGYARLEVAIVVGGERVRAQTYLSERTTLDERPTALYRALMLAGAREHQLPAAFVAELESLAVIGREAER
jgi:gamma-glutamylcyclotransferase (GGCT)/AIG2-like uncharacterized protein YtfP